MRPASETGNCPKSSIDVKKLANGEYLLSAKKEAFGVNSVRNIERMVMIFTPSDLKKLIVSIIVAAEEEEWNK